MAIYAVVETLRAGYDCEEEMVKSLGFKVGDKFELEVLIWEVALQVYT